MPEAPYSAELREVEIMLASDDPGPMATRSKSMTARAAVDGSFTVSRLIPSP
jgi:hypothetical protein